MELTYPITSELLTLDYATFQTFKRELRQQHDLSILQYRVMSLIQRDSIVYEACLIRDLDVNPSQLSKDLSKLAKRGVVSWKTKSGSFRSWSLTYEGEAFLQDADNTIIQVYDRFFAGLDFDIEESAQFGLVMINQFHGVVRVKDERFFYEQAFFESILPFVHIITTASQSFNLTSTQFRILFELLEHGPTLKASLAKQLMLTRSTVNWACEALEKIGHVRVIAGKTGKVRPVLLTDAGRETAENLSEVIDRAYCGIRVWSPEEKRNYLQIADYFVKTFAR